MNEIEKTKVNAKANALTGLLYNKPKKTYEYNGTKMKITAKPKNKWPIRPYTRATMQHFCPIDGMSLRELTVAIKKPKARWPSMKNTYSKKPKATPFVVYVLLVEEPQSI